MGLKLLTLAMHSLTGKPVKLHDTGKTANVTAEYKGGNIVYFLTFEDGKVEPVHWSAESQGYVSLGEELDEAPEPV
jgi:hypothetical protein